MYPFIRTISKVLAARRAEPLDLTETDSFSMWIWPIDLDGFMELNNGRILTLFDIGRFTLATRVGLLQLLGKKGWAFAVAGSFVRYRRRVTLFQRVEIRTRAVGRDGRFFLMEQAMWCGETCTSHMLIRTVVTSKDGVVDPAEVLEALGHPRDYMPQVPNWAIAMTTAEGDRPWPPDF